MKIISISECEICPYHVFDDNNVVERFGRSWCRKGNFEIPAPDTIDARCPLKDGINVVPRGWTESEEGQPKS